jgi:hypothetical protein
MRNFLLKMREVVWTSVLALVLSALAVISAFTEASTLTLGFGLSAIAFALLSNRE